MRLSQCDIQLRGLRFYAYHGVLEQERRVGGDYTLDLVLTLSDASRAIFHDDLAGTVNYAEVYALVEREMAQPSALIECVAGRILQALFDAFPLVASATVTLCKVNPPMGADTRGCAVSITAERD